MWERFTYYGIQSILILFLVTASGRGGLGFDDQSASAIWGLFMGGTYLLSLLGGWVADQLTGGRVAIASGGVLITIGNALLAAGSERLFFLGLGCNVLGVGLLKPNVSNTVGALYPEGGSRRDAGFSIFYVGINVGSLLGPMFVPVVARNYGWHAGFALPALGMLFGVAQFLATRRYLGSAGTAPTSTRPRSWLALWVIVAVIGALAALLLSGVVRVNPVTLAARVSWMVGLLLAGYLLYIAFLGGLSRAERHRVLAMMTLFAASTVFWMAYMQIFGSLTLFAQRYTDLDVFGWQIPAGDLQTVPAGLHHRAGASLRGAVGCARKARPGPVFAGKVRLGTAADGGGHARHVPRGAARAARAQGLPAMADRRLSRDRLRRAVPVARGPLRHHEVGAGPLRRPDHGPVFPHSGAGKLPGRPAVRRLQRAASCDASGAVPEALLVDRGRGRRDAVAHTAGEAADGGRALSNSDAVWNYGDIK